MRTLERGNDRRTIATSNNYRICGDSVEIILPQGISTFIDRDDLDRVLQYRWQAMWNEKRQRYTVSRTYRTEEGRGSQLLARFLCDEPEGYQIDHWDHNTLNNRKSNLRKVTNQRNHENRKGANTSNITGIRGVTLYEGSRYRVTVRTKGKNYYGGYFDLTPEGLREADQAARALRKQLGFMVNE